jgi:hypothetical protein
MTRVRIAGWLLCSLVGTLGACGGDDNHGNDGGTAGATGGGTGGSVGGSTCGQAGRGGGGGSVGGSTGGQAGRGGGGGTGGGGTGGGGTGGSKGSSPSSAPTCRYGAPDAKASCATSSLLSPARERCAGLAFQVAHRRIPVDLAEIDARKLLPPRTSRELQRQRIERQAVVYAHPSHDFRMRVHPGADLRRVPLAIPHRWVLDVRRFRFVCQYGTMRLPSAARSRAAPACRA